MVRRLGALRPQTILKQKNSKYVVHFITRKEYQRQYDPVRLLQAQYVVQTDLFDVALNDVFTSFPLMTTCESFRCDYQEMKNSFPREIDHQIQLHKTKIAGIRRGIIKKNLHISETKTEIFRNFFFY